MTCQKATKSRSLVCFSTVRSTLAADLTWPHWETTAAYEIKTIETEHEQYVARCSPSLSLLQQIDGLEPPLIWFILYARHPGHQVSLGFFSVFFFVKEE